MKSLIIAAVVFVTATSSVLAQQVKEAPKQYIGEVIIVGNTITQDAVIRSVIDLAPGRELAYPELKLAERNLARLGIFKGKPTVTIVQSPIPFKDILIKVEEGETTSISHRFTWGPKVPAFTWLYEDRNFDLLRLPTSIADFAERKAFRGGGQKLRVGIAIGVLLEPRLVFSVTSMDPLPRLLVEMPVLPPAPLPYFPTLPTAK